MNLNLYYNVCTTPTMRHELQTSTTSNRELVPVDMNNRLQIPNESVYQYVLVVIARCDGLHRLYRLFARLPQGLSQPQQRATTGLN